MFKLYSIEDVVVHKGLGYAGRVDFVAGVKNIGPCLIDLKTQRVKLDKKGQPKPNFYESWPMQLAAYRHAIEHQGAFHVPERVASLVIGSEEPVPASFKLWDDEAKHLAAFLNALEIWKYVKGYNPTEAAK